MSQVAEWIQSGSESFFIFLPDEPQSVTMVETLRR